MLWTLLFVHTADAKPYHSTVTFISDTNTLTPGQTYHIGILLIPKYPWHTYWQNPGDSGAPTHIRFHAPQNITIGPIMWPAPTYITAYSYTNYGYNKPTLFAATVTLPMHYTATTCTFSADISWVMCHDICVANHETITLTLPVTDTPSGPSHWATRFTQSFQSIPQKLPGTHAVFSVQAHTLTMRLHPIPDTWYPDAQYMFFPYTPGIVSPSAPQHISVIDHTLSLTQNISPHFTQPPKTFSGIVVVTDTKKSQVFHLDASLA